MRWWGAPPLLGCVYFFFFFLCVCPKGLLRIPTAQRHGIIKEKNGGADLRLHPQNSTKFTTVVGNFNEKVTFSFQDSYNFVTFVALHRI